MIEKISEKQLNNTDKQILFKCDINLNQNRNGRYYSPEVLAKAFSDYNERVIAGEACGIFGNSTSPEIDLANVSHIITNIDNTDDIYTVTGKTVITPKGKALAALIDEGVNLKCISHAYGSVNENNEVNDDYTIVSIDIVSGES